MSTRDSRMYEIFEQQPEIRSFLPDVTISSNRCIGIEVELENAHSLFDEAYKYWRVIPDDSLRNSGAELVLRQPLAGNDLKKALHELSGVFYNHPEVNASERTSVHVHVDARDLTVNQVGNVLTTYIAAESALYKLGGKNRYDNIYCPGVSAATEQMPVMRQIVRPRNTTDVIRACNEWCKYTGINLRSIIERGSIEFRAHEGTTSVTRIREWVNVLLTMFRYAENVENPKQVGTHASLGASAFAERVFRQKANVVLEDGVYERYSHNNYINVIDLLREAKEYKPEPAKDVTATTSDIESILAELDNFI